MEYIEGEELYEQMRQGRKDEDETRTIFRQIVAAVHYLHTNNICHRDIKAENIIIDNEGNAHLIDFGFSRIVEKMEKLTTFCGSLFYCPPELLQEKPYNGDSVDIWSLGVLLFVMMNAYMPFRGNTIEEILKEISENAKTQGQYTTQGNYD